MGEIFERPVPPHALRWTGERLTTETSGQTEIEHLHRYFFARSLCRGLDVLDVASGEGYGAAMLAQVARSVVGVELAEDAVAHARAAYPGPNLRYLAGDARSLPLRDASVDAVVSFETIEHFYEHDAFLAEIRRVLRPGGLLVISSPERDVYSPAGSAPNPYHARELTRAEFGTLLHRHFPHVDLYAQRPMLGSAVMPEAPPAAGAQPLVTFERRDQRLFEASTGLPRPIYLVALASDAPLRRTGGSLYIETGGVEAIFNRLAAADAAERRLAEEAGQVRQMRAELGRHDERRLAQEAEAQDCRRELARRAEEVAALERERAALERRLDLAGRELSADRRAREALQSALRETGEELAAARGLAEALQNSVSWRLTGPLRGFLERHPGALHRLQAVTTRHPRTLDLAMRSARGAWRLATLRPFRGGGAAPPALPVPTAAPISLPFAAPPRQVTFDPRPLPPPAAPHPEALPAGGGRRGLLLGHVLPYPPRAGNEYRIHRLLAWLAGQGWDMTLLLVPLPGEEPPAARRAELAAVYPNLVICQHDGTVWHRLPGGEALLEPLRGRRPRAMAALLQEDDAGGQSRLLGHERTFCPDVAADLLCHLQQELRAELLIGEYVFMTRAFPLLQPRPLTLVDTHDVFSSKAGKVVRFGVRDTLSLTPEEEASLLRRADGVLAIQPEEAAEIERLVPGRAVLSVGVDIPAAGGLRAPVAAPVAILVASANAMNLQGLQSFLDLAWPLVRREVPEAELHVVGSVGEGLLDPPDGVRLLGRVERLDLAYAAARVAINPAVAGTGLKIKTVEALGFRLPVVTWPTGAEGIPAEARPFCHVAGNWFTFARALIRLLTDDAAAEAILRENDTLARAFSPDIVYEPLRRFLGRRDGTSGPT
ncbi:methyltransferase domain-containing protein [Roseomonas sp. OT10]|uniref:methyltransferase domain-containing protein n=1 Tax=Roseomonas cutis TaxID=2897332 RepID=UPI001E638036|nr:methyltransferase domain-containing protein [Roseomonas sp. OT10]UFN50704.1 methyltransferase domain-containing protein [Roseomonas sp. OT10]